MTLYGLVRIVKFLAVMTYVAAVVAGFTAPSALQRERAVHSIASPALLAIWCAGAALAWLRGTSLTELWIVGGFLLSLTSSLLLIHSAARGVRTLRLFAGCVVPLGLAIVLMVLRPKWSLLLLLTGLVAGCAHLGMDYRKCDDVPLETLALLPARLSETGLYEDAALTRTAARVQAYRPRFELWSDGAQKLRWVQLPLDQPIDTHDMDAWRFPQGTKFWKEFSYAGKRIETRLLQKLGPAPDAWAAVSYVWSADGSDAIIAPEGQSDAGGTPHDVPAAAECFGCHAGTMSRVLGFSAIQLSAPLASEGDVSLRSLSESGALTHPPANDVSLPGDAATQQALGYLHANCGHCHNQRRPPRTGARCFDPERRFDLSLYTAALSSSTEVAAYRSTLDGIVVPGDPEHSELYRRMEGGSIFLPHMPPLATAQLDGQALNAVFRWIESLPRR